MFLKTPNWFKHAMCCHPMLVSAPCAPHAKQHVVVCFHCHKVFN